MDGGVAGPQIRVNSNDIVTLAQTNNVDMNVNCYWSSATAPTSAFPCYHGRKSCQCSGESKSR